VAAPRRAPDALDMGVLALGPAGAIRLQVWTRGFGDPVALAAVQEAAAARMRTARLAAHGLPPSVMKELDSASPAVEHMGAEPTPQAPSTPGRPAVRAAPGASTPAAAQGVAMASAFLLWAMILTGAGLLLNSVIEEKSGRILEVLMASASIPEILAGKIVGMAALSATTLGIWATFGLAIASHGRPQLLSAMVAGATAHGLIGFFLLFFLAGYLMYAAVFAAIGAFCETPREAQALLGPLMLLMSVPILFLSMSMQRPDAPIIQVLSWIPPFTPFLMTARVAAGLPAWQAVLALVMMAATTTTVVWLAGRAFAAGALSGGKLDLRAFMGRRLKGA
jgi:ABC-2 type transport system permease protein